jgi:hypothetical protein
MAQQNTVSLADAETARKACRAKAYADPTGTFYSAKNGRRIQTSSAADYRFCHLAEACGTILAYEERPDLLILIDRGRPVPFAVDFAVTMKDGSTVLIGLRLQDQGFESAGNRLLNLAQKICTGRGIPFVQIPDQLVAPFVTRLTPDGCRGRAATERAIHPRLAQLAYLLSFAGGDAFAVAAE